MKLLFDSTELSYYLENYGHRAGVFNVALNIFREFRKKNIEITFICNFKRYYFMKEVLKNVDEFKNIELLDENSFINRFFAFLNYIVRNCNKKIVYGILSLSRYYENLFYVKNKKNEKQLKDFEYYFSPFTPACDEIMQAFHIKRFMMLHDTIPIIENKNKIPNNPRLWCYRLYNTINTGDIYFTNSENTRQDFLKFYPKLNPNKITTTYLGANENFSPKKNINNKENYIFSLCTLGKRKNLIFAIKNFFKFIEKNQINDLKFVLGGSVWTKFENELRKTLENYDKSKIVFEGYITEEKLAQYYSNALMFVFPSLYEGFGLPVLEAMQCGCPVITSNISSMPEVIGECGITIDPRCNSDMIEAYEKFYYDKFFRNVCIERGLARAKNFSWEKCANQIINIMENNK